LIETSEFHENTATTEAQREDVTASEAVSPVRSSISAAGRRKVRWVDEDQCSKTGPGAKFADELELVSPWTPRCTVTELDERRLDHCTAVLTRSNQHDVVVLDAEPSTQST